MIQREIAVIGAGVAGLASAILLSRQGHRVTLYERFDRPQPVGSGLMIQPTGLAALQRLGLRHELEALGQRIERLHGLTAHGTTIFDLAYTDLQPVRYALAVHRAALHGVLWNSFARSGAALEVGCEITGVNSLAGGRAAPVDARGRVLPAADLVIDASGARSPLRQAVTQRQPTPFKYGAVWATIPDYQFSAGTLAQRYVSARVMIGYLPLGRMSAEASDCAALFWSLKPQTHEAWCKGFSAWREDAIKLWPEIAPAIAGLTGPDEFTLARYAHFTASHLARGSLVLVGDAAHVTSPQLGQGANQGLIDAVVLSDALAACRELADALKLYERLRRGHVRFYQWASALMTPLFQSDSTLLGTVRDLTFRHFTRVPYLHREMIRTLAGLKTGLLTDAAPDDIVNCALAAPEPPSASLVREP